MNLVLGAASLALIGCHSQKASVGGRAVRDGKVIAMYGVPSWRADSIPSQQTDSVPEEEETQDSIQQAPQRPAGGKIMLKYGVPPTRM